MFIRQRGHMQVKSTYYPQHKWKGETGAVVVNARLIESDKLVPWILGRMSWMVDEACADSATS